MSKASDKKSLAWEVLSYSDRRFDFLLVSISGGGIYICLETIKFLTEHNKTISKQIVISGVLFVIGIILNLISQYTSKLSNENSYLECEVEEEIEKNIDNGSYDHIKGKTEIDRFKKNGEIYNCATTILTLTNAGLVIAGLIFLISFFIFYL